MTSSPTSEPDSENLSPDPAPVEPSPPAPIPEGGLSKIEQQRGASLALGLGALLALGVLIVAKVAPEPGAEARAADFLSWAAAGGFLGGATRTLFKFVWYLRVGAAESPLPHLDRWFLFLAKPILGIAGGVLFFLTLNVGLGGLLIGAAEALRFGFLRVVFTAAVGGVFAESVFIWLEREGRRRAKAASGSA